MISAGLRTAVPLAAFLAAVIYLAGATERSGAAERAAVTIARLARGCGWAAFVLVAVLGAGLTATVSLDGAAVVMVPVARRLERVSGFSLRLSLMASIAVCNAASAIVPQGNPANLALMAGGREGPAAYLRIMAPAGIAASVIALSAIAIGERAALRRPLKTPPPPGAAGPGEAVVAAGLGVAAGLSVLAVWAGMTPWWPACVAAAAVAAALGRRGRPAPVRVPGKIVLWVGAGAALVTPAAGLIGRSIASARSPSALVAVAVAATAAAALVNNLPAAAALGAAGAHGLPAAAGVIGLAVGALAARRGSVATMLLIGLGDPDGECGLRAGYGRTWVPVAALAVAAATAALLA